MSFVIKIISVIGFSFVLSACASFYDVTTNNAPQYVKPLNVGNGFAISGRFLAKSATKNSYGNFTWVKSESSEELDFNTPLGQTVSKIMIQDGMATLTTADDTYTGDDLNAMMEDRLGFILPVVYLHYWIQGVPIPNQAVTANLHDGFSQLGWKIEYLAWYDPNHPKIIQCSKDDLIIKLLIAN